MVSGGRNSLILGILAAVGPFAIDMYIPALPAIAADLHASTAATQMTLLAFFVAFGACQLVYGPVSDVVGRKPPVFVGLVLFVIGSVGCALAPTIEWLIVLRVLQGIGASCSMAIPRAIIRDLHTGIEATRLMALVMLILSASPILAPLAGSILSAAFGWRAIFVAVAVVAASGLAMTTFFLAETLPPGARARADFRGLFAGSRQLLRSGRFLGLSAIGGLGMASFFTFLASSSFIYMRHFGLSPMLYGLAFAVNAVGFIGASQFAASLGARYGMTRVVTFAVAVYAIFALLHVALVAAGADSLPLMMVMLLATFTGLGLVIPSTMVLALDDHGPIAGLASALGGTLQMLVGGAMIGLVSLFTAGTALPMVAIIAACALGALALCFATLGREVPLAAAPD